MNKLLSGREFSIFVVVFMQIEEEKEMDQQVEIG
jgi:hypothetical protein